MVPGIESLIVIIGFRPFDTFYYYFSRQKFDQLSKGRLSGKMNTFVHGNFVVVN